MRIESKLCHLSESRAIVQVNGWINEKNVGSALAEGSTVEIAEDNAILRLNQRLTNFNSIRENIKINNNKEKQVDLPKNKNKIENINTEPSDWSNELTSIDHEIKRLNWTREDEINFLENNFGYNNRSKITKYNELIDYLDKLKMIKTNNSFDTKSNLVDKLMDESEMLLKDLSWDYNQGREYLQNQYNVSTRKDLDQIQLLSFVNNLKSIKNQRLSN